jgi:hypothetical protein
MTSNRGPRRIAGVLTLALATLAVDGLFGSTALANGHHKKTYVLVDADPAPPTRRVIRRYVREVAAPDAEPDRDLATPQAPAKEATPPAKNTPAPVAPKATEQAAPKTVTRRVLRTYVEEEEVPATETRDVVTREVPATRVVRVVRAAPVERVVYVREVAAPATEAVLVTKKCCLFGKGF